MEKSAHISRTGVETVKVHDGSAVEQMRRRAIDENMVMHGFLTVVHTRASDGKKTVLCKDNHNLLTNAGRDDIHNAIYENTGSASQLGFNHMALTLNTNAPSATQTILTASITTGGLTRVQAATTTHSGGTNTSVIKHLFTATATHTDVTKSGLFDTNTAGTIGHVNTFTDVTLQNNDTLEVTWTMTLG